MNNSIEDEIICYMWTRLRSLTPKGTNTYSQDTFGSTGTFNNNEKTSFEGTFDEWDETSSRDANNKDTFTHNY